VAGFMSLDHKKNTCRTTLETPKGNEVVKVESDNEDSGDDRFKKSKMNSGKEAKKPTIAFITEPKETTNVDEISEEKSINSEEVESKEIDIKAMI
jgi:hypothetical protein